MSSQDRTQDAGAPRRAVTSSGAVGWSWNHEVSGHRKASCCAVRLGPMFMLAPQRGQRQMADGELVTCAVVGGWQASSWRASASREVR